MAQLAERGVRSDSGTSLRMPQGLPGEFSLPVRIDASALFGRSVYRCRRGSIPHVSGQSHNKSCNFSVSASVAPEIVAYVPMPIVFFSRDDLEFPVGFTPTTTVGC